jgi:branched-chain amino acid transport system substrate-binding protein
MKRQLTTRRLDKKPIAALFTCMTSIAVLALTGCGAGAGNKKITIGAMSDLSAQFSANGRGLLSGLRIAVHAINDHGGIDGKQVKLVFLDDTAQVSRGVADATRLIGQERATVIAGFLLSNVCKAVEPLAERKKIPMLCNAGDATQFGTPPSANVFLPTVLQPRENLGMFTLAGKVVTKPQPRAAFIGLASAAIQQQQAGQKATAQKKGWPIAASQTVPLTATDLSAQISAIAASHPDIVFSNLADATSILFVRGLRAAGVTAPIVASDSSTTVTVETTKDPGYYVVEALSPGGTPGGGYQKYLDAAKAAGIDPTKPFVNRGYLQGLIIEAALRACKGCEGQKLIDSLNKLTLDTDGLTAGPVTYTAADHVGIHKLYAFRYDPATAKAKLFATDLPTGA